MRYLVCGLTTTVTAILLAGCSEEGGLTGLDARPEANLTSQTSSQCAVYKPTGDLWEPAPAHWLSTHGYLWQALDEEVPDDDASYIYRLHYGPDTVSVTGTVGLYGMPHPPGATGTVRIRWKVMGDYSVEYRPTLLDVRVLSGPDYIGSFSVWPSPNYVTGTRAFYLSEGGAYYQVKLDGFLKPVGFGIVEARITSLQMEVCW